MAKIIIGLIMALLGWNFCFGSLADSVGKKNHQDSIPDYKLLQISENLLYRVKLEESTLDLETELAGLNKQRLIFGLNNDAAIKTFWVNIYNAWYQILAIRGQKKRPGIFTEKLILIAGIQLSLDDIEHGILRKYRWKYSKGYLPYIFTRKLIRELAVARIDFRIHFALNCGAKSCPPIAFYTYNSIDWQLTTATQSFLKTETIIDSLNQQVFVTKIMDWFIADFGGKKGIRKLVTQVFKKDVSLYQVKFKKYDWGKSLHYFESDTSD